MRSTSTGPVLLRGFPIALPRWFLGATLLEYVYGRKQIPKVSFRGCIKLQIHPNLAIHQTCLLGEGLQIHRTYVVLPVSKAWMAANDVLSEHFTKKVYLNSFPNRVPVSSQSNSQVVNFISLPKPALHLWLSFSVLLDPTPSTASIGWYWIEYALLYIVKQCHLVNLWQWPFTCNLEKWYFFRSFSVM